MTPEERPKLSTQLTQKQLKFLTPLLWAPTFPLLRIATSSPGLQHWRPFIIAGTIVVANLHGFWLINNPDLSDL